jgi:uncharacterized protein YjbI with pentapeptide repeats
VAEKPDPFDVAARERSLNRAAVRVAIVWVGYLIFALYLVVVTATATHRELFLEEPLKLPALNVDLPLYWFFVRAPILFVLLHVFVLLQIRRLGRAMATYDEFVNGPAGSAPENASMQRRFANALFGSPQEREGRLGALRAMAWVTLALAPIYIILAFQFAFLPYHSHLATWTHRLLLFTELAIVFLLWPRALNTRRAIDRPGIRWRAFPTVAVILAFAVSVLLGSFPGEPHFNLLTGNSFSAVQCDRWISELGPRFLNPIFGTDMRLDRLALRNVKVVDSERLDKIEKLAAEKGQRPFEGERTQNFRERDLNCGAFSWADLRRADLYGAQLRGADLPLAQLQGADLRDAQLDDAHLGHAQLQGADLRGAQLQGANLRVAELQDADLRDARLKRADLEFARLEGADLRDAQLEGANLSDAQLEGANLSDAQLQGANLQRANSLDAEGQVDLAGAQLQGANLHYAHFQGANLHDAQLQGTHLEEAWLIGADLRHTQLQGANLFEAWLRGADLSYAQLQGANLVGAYLDGADLSYAQLQGANLAGANLDGADLSYAQLQGADLRQSEVKLALLSDVFLWRARFSDCSGARVINPRFDAVPVDAGSPDQAVAASTPDATEDFIERIVAAVGDNQKAVVRKRMHEALIADIDKDQLAAMERGWRQCATSSEKIANSVYLQQHADRLIDLACFVADPRALPGMIRTWIWNVPIADNPRSAADRLGHSSRLARGLLGLNGSACLTAKNLSDEDKKRLLILADESGIIVRGFDRSR